jgi:hypothetical protein
VRCFEAGARASRMKVTRESERTAERNGAFWSRFRFPAQLAPRAGGIVASCSVRLRHGFVASTELYRDDWPLASTPPTGIWILYVRNRLLRSEAVFPGSKYKIFFGCRASLLIARLRSTTEPYISTFPNDLFGPTRSLSTKNLFTSTNLFYFKYLRAL